MRSERKKLRATPCDRLNAYVRHSVRGVRGNRWIASAQVTSGEQVLRPILDDFLDAYPTVSANLYVLDRFVNLIDVRM